MLKIKANVLSSDLVRILRSWEVVSVLIPWF